MGKMKITDDMHTAQYVLWDLVDDILKLKTAFTFRQFNFSLNYISGMTFGKCVSA